MQQRMMGGTDSMGQMPDPFNAPTEFLLAFLNRISVLDKEGFFQRPVREEEAPNYYTIIKQPMCFADMREKISAGAYQTWRQLRDDFNLIHENAKKFNSNKTLVHRAALNLQKKGTQILAQYELQVRKALAVLHPLGAEQPAGQAPASDASGMAGDTRMDVAASPTTNASMSGAALLPEQNGDVAGLDGGCQRRSMSGPPSPEGLDAGSLPMTGSALGLGQVQQSLPPVLIPPAPRDSIVGYISDEEDQPLLVVGTDAAAATAASAASRSLRGLGPSHALPLDALLSQLRSTAARVTYSFPGRRKNQEGLKEACSGGAGAGVKVYADARPSMATAASKEWQKARRPVELKARWLELRMRELRGQQERLQAQINWLQQRKVAGDDGLAGAALAAGMGRPAVGVLVAAASLAAAPCATEREALSSAAAEFLSASRVSSSLYFRLRTLSSLSQGPAAANPTSACAGASISAASSAGTSGARTQTGANALPPAFTPDGVVSPRGGSDSRTPPASSDPDTSELRSAMPPPQLPPPGQAQQTILGQQQQQPQGPGRPAAAQQPLPLLPQQMPPCDEAESDKMLPGAIFASLDLLEQRLSVVRMRLQDAYKFDANRLVVGRTQGPYASRAPSYQLGSSGSLAAPGSAAAAGGPSAGQGAVKRQSSGQGRRPGGLTVLTRFDSMSMPSCKSTGGGGGKRKRSEIELLTGDIGTPLTSYGRTSLDRSASVTTIVIPPVRELAPDEFRARIVAATTWSQHYHTIGPSALGSVPPEIHSVLRKRRRRGLCGSGEDFEEEMAMGGLGGIRSLPGASDDEGGGALLTSGMGGPMSGYSDSGIGDDEGSSTSSEDTSDEAYAARHRIMEAEEHRRYAAVVAEGQRRRNKGGSNASSSQQNQVGGPSGSTAGGSGSASQAKERAKVGNKTPRFSSSFKLKEGLTLVPPELPPDGPDMILPSATYGYYQPYQPPMVGVTTASALPPTPGSTPAAGLAHPQPVVVQQAVAQRTSPPPAMLHASPSGVVGQALQQRPPFAAATMATGLPCTSTVAGSGRPPVPPPQPLPTSQQSMQLPSPHSHVTQSPHPAGGLMERAVASVVTGAQLVTPQQTSQTQEPPEPAQVQAPAQSQPQPLARAHVHGQAQQQTSQTTKPAEEKQQLQRPPVAASRQQEKPANVPVVQQEQLQQEQQQQGQHQQQPDGQHVQVSQPAAAPQQQDGPDAAQPAAATGCSKAKVTVESTAASSQSETVTSTNVTGSEAAAAQPPGAAAAPKPASPAPPEPSTARGQPQPQGSAAGQHNAKITTDAVTVAATAGSGITATNAAPTAAAPATASGAAEAHVAAAAAAAASGTAAGPVASVLAGSSVTQAQQVAMSVGASALLGSQAAAAMIAQSPAMSLQYLTSMQGLGAGAGTGGSNSTLSAAATSILLAAAAAASAGGQSAANNLMGNARTSALQQLAAGAPAAQVFANAAAAAAAAAAAGSSAGGGAGAGLGGLGQHGKQQSLFAAAGVSAARGLPAQNPLTTAATMSGIGGLGGIAGLPAAFQSLQGFPQSLAGFNLNLAGSGNLGLGLQHATQRLPDGLAGLGVLPQGVQHLQAHHLQGVPAPAPRQGQQMGQAEGGRGVGRPRRASRTAPIVDEEDEEWEDDDEEEEEAASPNARTRRSTRAQRRGSNGMRGTDIHGNGGPEAATRQPKRRAAKGAHNWAVLLASDSSDEEDGDEEWAARAGRRPPEAGGRVRGRGRRSAG
ncbi:hypothetical protein Vretimale_17612 [Volvox reticuliferus]|uniref:Bromo domain-containing protein n=1 Tax=Volvox reticuliferus TaxID=1737510 RepID=A0A8J4GV53_9CHLO|nr:hypothetical protein Vretimale_17612 [Volvox reticuliferus]